jgi:hypothetical protein
MAARLILLVIGILYVATGVWMVASPDGWYAAVPGVPMTGPNNHHFVSDIGLAYIASGAGLVLGFRAGAIAAVFAAAGSLWPLLHAGLHVWGWMAHGFPTAANVAISEIVGVVLLGVLGFGFAMTNARREGVF